MTDSLWITGIAGFTGRYLCRFLEDLHDKPRIVGLDLTAEGPIDRGNYHRIDLNDSDEIARLAHAEPPGWVIHLAGAIPPADEGRMWRANVGATLGLLSGLISAECLNVRVVSIGSAAEYAPTGKNPIEETAPCGGSSCYGRIKWAQSTVTLGVGRDVGLPTMVARPFNLVGPELPSTLVAGGLCQQFAQEGCGDEILIGNMDSERDFVDVRDAVAAYWSIAVKGVAGQAYNVCSAAPTSIRRLVELLADITASSRAVRVDPHRVRENDVPVCYGDNTKLTQATGWQPSIPLRESLAAMLAASVHVR